MTTFINKLIHQTQKDWAWHVDDTNLSFIARRVGIVFAAVGLTLLPVAIGLGVVAGSLATVSLIVSGSLVLGSLPIATLASSAFKTLLIASRFLSLGVLILFTTKNEAPTAEPEPT